jgi:molybdopterin converting factor subunit 1
MRVVVKLFAIVREKAGAPSLTLELPVGSTVGQALAAVAQQCPAVAEHLGRSACAVNQSYMPPSTMLHDADELAIIPPVSGG